MLNFILLIVIIFTIVYLIDMRSQTFDTLTDPDKTISIEHFCGIHPLAKSKIIQKTNKVFDDHFGKYTFALGRMPLVVRDLSDGKIVGALALNMYGEFPIVSHLYTTSPGYIRRVNNAIERYLEKKKCRRVGGWCTKEMVEFYEKFGAVITDTDSEKERYLMVKWL